MRDLSFPNEAFDNWLTTPPPGHYSEGDNEDVKPEDICECGHPRRLHCGFCSWLSEGAENMCLCDDFQRKVEK